jgi:hypothetical protein
MLGERLEPEEHDVAETLAVTRLRSGVAVDPRSAGAPPSDAGNVP